MSRADARLQAPGRVRGARGGMSAATRAVDPAGRVTVSSVRSRSRSSDSASQSGTVASRREPACTSGRSMTASTRLARLPGGWAGGKEQRNSDGSLGTQRASPSAAATVSSSSLTSTRRGWSTWSWHSSGLASSDADKAMPAATGVKQTERAGISDRFASERRWHSERSLLTAGAQTPGPSRTGHGNAPADGKHSRPDHERRRRRRDRAGRRYAMTTFPAKPVSTPVTRAPVRNSAPASGLVRPAP